MDVRALQSGRDGWEHWFQGGKELGKRSLHKIIALHPLLSITQYPIQPVRFSILPASTQGNPPPPPYPPKNKTKQNRECLNAIRGDSARVFAKSISLPSVETQRPRTRTYKKGKPEIVFWNSPRVGLHIFNWLRLPMAARKAKPSPAKYPGEEPYPCIPCAIQVPHKHQYPGAGIELAYYWNKRNRTWGTPPPVWGVKGKPTQVPQLTPGPFQLRHRFIVFLYESAL